MFNKMLQLLSKIKLKILLARRKNENIHYYNPSQTMNRLMARYTILVVNSRGCFKCRRGTVLPTGPPSSFHPLLKYPPPIYRYIVIFTTLNEYRYDKKNSRRVNLSDRFFWVEIVVAVLRS